MEIYLHLTPLALVHVYSDLSRQVRLPFNSYGTCEASDFYGTNTWFSESVPFLDSWQLEKVQSTENQRALKFRAYRSPASRTPGTFLLHLRSQLNALVRKPSFQCMAHIRLPPC